MFKINFHAITRNLFNKSAEVIGGEFTELEKKYKELSSFDRERLLAEFGSSTGGLSETAARLALEKYGPNELSQTPRKTFIRDIYDRLKNPLVIQLLIICFVSLFMGDTRSAVVVGGMIVLSVALSYFQESRSGKAMEDLRAIIETTCTAVRDGRGAEIPLDALVPGDVVVLQVGSIIPADLILFSGRDFYLNQSALTGESMPVEKTAAASGSAGKSVFELENVCFQGANVVSGYARGLVIATGGATYLGKMAKKLTAVHGETSFDKGVNGFTWLMIRLMLVMVSAVFLIVGFSKGDWISALLFGLAVAVGLTPEMLPMIITVNLSKGAMAMSRKKVIIKKLSAIQNFGAMNVLCADKTGTLTQDRIILEKYVDVTGRKDEETLRYAYMNSFYQTGLKNLLDRAVLAHSDLDVERACKKVDEIPFDFRRKRMSVAVEYEGMHVLITKGAVEDVYRSCSRYQVDDEVFELQEMILNDLMEDYASLSSQGYRVLAIAYKEFETSKTVFSEADEADLILLGYIAFLDPPKETAAQALKALSALGVEVKVLTGDNELVTRKVCADVGLSTAKLFTGAQLGAFTPEEFDRSALGGEVFVRLTPSQKEEIISSLRRQGRVVGFMGDGINDAPAMKAADVGISVDTAVDIAKESADIILLEKSLLVLEQGVLECRKVFGNIIKYIKMGASSNFGNMFSVLGASYFLPFLPMAPAQILLNNLLYDFSQAGIPSDRVDPEYLKAPRKWNIANIRKFMFFIGPISSIFDYLTFFLMLYFYNCAAFSAAGTALGTKVYLEKLFHTGWFVESLLTQTLIVHVIRTRQLPFIKSRASLAMTLTTLSVVAVGIYLPHSRFADYLGFVALPASYWAWLALFLLSYTVITHLVKTWFYSKFGDD